MKKLQSLFGNGAISAICLAIFPEFIWQEIVKSKFVFVVWIFFAALFILHLASLTIKVLTDLDKRRTIQLENEAKAISNENLRIKTTENANKKRNDNV